MKTTKRERLEKKPLQIRQIAKTKRKGNKKASRLTSAKNIATIERRRKVMSLRRDGWEYEDIAKVLDIPSITAREDVKYCLNLTATELVETADEERELQKFRLNAMLKPHLQFATEPHKEIRRDPRTGAEIIIEMPPDPAYANVVLKIEERRSKLLALDKPEIKKLDITGIREYVGVDMDQV